MTRRAFDIDTEEDRFKFAFVSVLRNRLYVCRFPPGRFRSHKRDDRIFFVITIDFPIMTVQHNGAPVCPGFDMIEKNTNCIILAQGLGLLPIGGKKNRASRH